VSRPTGGNDFPAVTAGGTAGRGSGRSLADPMTSGWLQHYETVSRKNRKRRSKRLRPRLGQRRRRISPAVLLLTALGAMLAGILLVMLFA
jgi:hypothetical protein